MKLLLSVLFFLINSLTVFAENPVVKPIRTSSFHYSTTNVVALQVSVNTIATKRLSNTPYDAEMDMDDSNDSENEEQSYDKDRCHAEKNSFHFYTTNVNNPILSDHKKHLSARCSILIFIGILRL